MISDKASSLVTPASDLYNLRGPVKLSKVTKQLYESRYAQSGRLVYEKDGPKKDKDEITITY